MDRVRSIPADESSELERKLEHMETRLTIELSEGEGAVDGATSAMGMKLWPVSPWKRKPLLSYEALEAERGICKVKPRSPRRIADVVRQDPLGVVQRAGVIAKQAVRLAIATRDVEDDRTKAAMLRDALAQLGPCFVKVGQALANRPDVLPPVAMEELTRLMDQAEPFQREIARDIVLKELGKPLEDVFERFPDAPVAAASIGQVYRAKLIGGAEVAVKVQRPGAKDLVEKDLALLRWLAGSPPAKKYGRENLGCDLQVIVDEFGETLLEELDYKQEANNMRDFGNNFNGDPNVAVPFAYPEYTTEKLLVMSWLDGVRCTDLDAMRGFRIDIDEFIQRGVASGLRQLLEFGLFHGDPHPGNVFAMPDGRIGYVDFGNVVEISQTNKEALLDAVIHAMNEDYEEMARDFVRLGFIAEGTDIRPLVPALRSTWRESVGSGIADFSFRDVTNKFSTLVYLFPIRIPARFALVIRTLLTQEGICLTLNPQFRFLEAAYPYTAKRLLSDPLYSSRLCQILIKGGVFDWERLHTLVLLSMQGARKSGFGVWASSMLDGVKVVFSNPRTVRDIALAMLRSLQLAFRGMVSTWWAFLRGRRPKARPLNAPTTHGATPGYSMA